MEKLIEALEKAQHDVGFLRNDLLEANRLAANNFPVAGMVIADLLAQETALAIKLNELTSLYEIKWPNYCRRCYGNGGFIDYEYRGEFHGVPASEQIYNYCTQCIESNECPRCRSQENNFYSALDSDEVQLTCFSCGWKDGDPGINK